MYICVEYSRFYIIYIYSCMYVSCVVFYCYQFLPKAVSERFTLSALSNKWPLSLVSRSVEDCCYSAVIRSCQRSTCKGCNPMWDICSMHIEIRLGLCWHVLPCLGLRVP